MHVYWLVEEILLDLNTHFPYFLVCRYQRRSEISIMDKSQVKSLNVRNTFRCNPSTMISSKNTTINQTIEQFQWKITKNQWIVPFLRIDVLLNLADCKEYRHRLHHSDEYFDGWCQEDCLAHSCCWVDCHPEKYRILFIISRPSCNFEMG